MFKEPPFMITFQLALIGLILIGGLFLVWKGIARIEEKVDMLLLERDMKASCPFKYQLDTAMGGSPVEESSRASNPFEEDSRMAKLFGEETSLSDEGEGNVYIFSSVPFQSGENDESGVKIEEEPPKEKEEPVIPAMFSPETPSTTTATPIPAPAPVPASAPAPVDDNSSVASAEGHPISRTKLRTMNLDRLKRVCMERGLDTEGTKNQLIDRILQA